MMLMTGSMVVLWLEVQIEKRHIGGDSLDIPWSCDLVMLWSGLPSLPVIASQSLNRFQAFIDPGYGKWIFFVGEQPLFNIGWSHSATSYGLSQNDKSTSEWQTSHRRAVLKPTQVSLQQPLSKMPDWFSAKRAFLSLSFQLWDLAVMPVRFSVTCWSRNPNAGRGIIAAYARHVGLNRYSSVLQTMVGFHLLMISAIIEARLA
jgi:hypothetical protein